MNECNICKKPATLCLEKTWVVHHYDEKGNPTNALTELDEYTLESYWYCQDCFGKGDVLDDQEEALENGYEYLFHGAHNWKVV